MNFTYFYEFLYTKRAKLYNKLHYNSYYIDYILCFYIEKISLSLVLYIINITI